MNPRTAGLLIGLLVLVILLFEGSLALLRTRDVRASVSVQSNIPTATPTPRLVGQPTFTPDPLAASLRMTGDGRVLVDIDWSFRIGPRFPATTVRAVALTDDQRVVASAEYTFDCGSEPLNCTGKNTLTLTYGTLSEADGTPTPGVTPIPPGSEWPVGSYTVVVTRAFTGLADVEVSRQSILVLGR